MTDLSSFTFSGEQLTEDTLTSILQYERERAVGLDNDDDLNAHREMALEYFKGNVPDMPVASDEDGKPIDSNRSSATTTDLADMIETVMPDLMEVFLAVKMRSPLGPRMKRMFRAQSKKLIISDRLYFSATMASDTSTHGSRKRFFAV